MKNKQIQKNIKKCRFCAAVGIFILVLALSAVFGWASFETHNFSWFWITKQTQPVEFVSSEMPKIELQVAHVQTPEEVRGIYWTAYTAAGPRVYELTQYMLANDLNSVVIDLKLDGGELVFKPKDENLEKFMLRGEIIKDLDGLLFALHENGIYCIARLPVMRDSTFASLNPDQALQNSGGSLWKDATGAKWNDPVSEKASDYATALAKEAYSRGFDEVQFDYVRFPSDGRLATIQYPLYKETMAQTEVMQAFFKKIGEAMKESDIPSSFDLFGMTFWSSGGFGIGQTLAGVYPYADYISPMVYPSHYPAGFEGYRNPADFPYEIVNMSLDKGAEQLVAESEIPEVESRPKFRPWLQSFHIGAVYDAQKIDAQIRASRDAGASGWLLWNARNVYGEIEMVNN